MLYKKLISYLISSFPPNSSLILILIQTFPTRPGPSYLQNNNHNGKPSHRNSRTASTIPRPRPRRRVWSRQDNRHLGRDPTWTCSIVLERMLAIPSPT